MSNFWGKFYKQNTSDLGFLPTIFPMPISNHFFVQTDVINIYSKILTDVVERTEGIPEEREHLLWDNCLMSESSLGLITHLCHAMESKSELFLVYKNDVIRKATIEEQSQIKSDYAAQAKSSVGIYVSFSNYRRTDMVKLYSALEYSVVDSLYKSMCLSKAIQYKVNALRTSVGLLDKEEAKGQAKDMANALASGKDVYMDSEDSIETAQPNLEATKSSMDLINSKRCFYLNLPMSYVTGALISSGLGDKGIVDARAIERGLKSYFYSIIKPILEELFTIKVSYKSQDVAQVSTALEMLKTFELTSNEFVSRENKLKLLNMNLGLPEDALGDEDEAATIQVQPIVTPTEV